MKKLSLLFALSLSLFPIRALSEVKDPNALLIHAMHLIDLSSNAAAISSITAPVSSDIKAQVYTILGNTGRIENLLIYISGAYGVNLDHDELPATLKDEKDEIQAALKIFQTSDAENADEAYAKVIEEIDDLREKTLEYAEHPEVSESLRDFVKSNF